jgi:surfeit locus 1 family protein
MSRKLLISLFFTSGFFICGRAGFWQLKRKEWKENLIRVRSQYIDQEPIQLSLPLADIDLNFRPIKASGRFDHNKEMLFLRKYEDQIGYRVVTPFFIDSRNGFLVNRGWMPESYKDIRSRKETWDVVDITGVLREGETPSSYTPDNSPNLKEWFYMDLHQMAKYAGLSNQEATSYMIQEINWDRQRPVFQEEEIPEIPIRAVKSDLIYWFVMPYTHASYAAFWFATSAICLFFNIRILRKP